MILSQGQKVNQYSVISFIGSGGMGEVYLVEEEFTQNRYALKTLFPHHTQNEQFRERFIREAKIMAALNHPGIMQVHSFFQIDQQYYLVMDFLQGQTLKSLLRSNGCLNEPQALDIVGKLLVTLDYASSKGVIHRDIKPDNIYIQPDYSIKVMDFGIARMTSLERVTETGSKLGTLYYMSPEQIRGSSNIDPKTDVYSLGIVFYEMLFGCLPFDISTTSDYAIMDQIVNKPLPDFLHQSLSIGEKSKVLLEGMTQKDQNHRLSASEALYLLQSKDLKTSATVNNIPKTPKVQQEVLIPESQPYHQEKRRNPKNIVFTVIAVVALVIVISLLSGKKKVDESAGEESATAPADTNAVSTEPAPVYVPPKPYSEYPVYGMQLIEGGTFTMGDDSGIGKKDEAPAHQVTLNSYYLGVCELTQAEWNRVMNYNPSVIKGDDLPVENVTWYEALEYCNIRSMMEGLTPCYTINKDEVDPYNTNPNASFKWLVVPDWWANGYRLPTEAEWEYASRGGKLSKGYRYSGSNNSEYIAWLKSNSGGQKHPVGQKVANELGLYDMNGNVWEWCWDWIGDYQPVSFTNPTGASSGSLRAGRGSYWMGEESQIRHANRDNGIPSGKSKYLGFRVCRSVRD